MQHLQLDNTFWQFALALYGKAGVAEILLALQDEHGLDINLILYLAWLGESRIRIDEKALQPVHSFATEWQQSIMQPLRAARRQIKAKLGDGVLYQKAKALELSVEQEIIARLYAMRPEYAPIATNCALENLNRYLKALNKPHLSEIAVLMDKIQH